MRRKECVTTILGAVAIAAGLGAAPALAGEQTVKVKIAIDDYRYLSNSGEERFDGTIKSPEYGCAVGRPIDVYRVKQGRDERIQIGLSFDGADGWSGSITDRTPGSRELEAGRYYAVAPKGPHNGQPCAKAKSKPFRIGSAGSSIDLGYYFNSDPDYEFFEGFISADVRSCHFERPISIFRKRSGKDAKLAKVESVELDQGTSRYFYVVPEFTLGPETKSGSYYAVATKLPGCRQSRSNTVVVDRR